MSLTKYMKQYFKKRFSNFISTLWSVVIILCMSHNLKYFRYSFSKKRIKVYPMKTQRLFTQWFISRASLYLCDTESRRRNIVYVIISWERWAEGPLQNMFQHDAISIHRYRSVSLVLAHVHGIQQICADHQFRSSHL